MKFKNAEVVKHILSVEISFAMKSDFLMYFPTFFCIPINCPTYIHLKA